jgi:alpha-mannosidase
MKRIIIKNFVFFLAAAILLCLSSLRINAQNPDPGDLSDVYMVPNMHPASCGWLVNFSVERIYCANNYFVHMDRVNQDPNYQYVISEVNNMIAMLNFQPKRFRELKKKINQGHIENVNAMFLELTPNLSGGEAIVRMGVNGINWQKEMLGVKPRFNWMIDVTGFHEQLAQITAGLGLEAQVHCRHNISGSQLYMAESPDGTKMLTISPGHYANWREVFSTPEPLEDSVIYQLASRVENDKLEKVPFLVFAGSGDYSLPPKYQEYPTEFINQWEGHFPGSDLRFSTLGDYVDVIVPKIMRREVILPVIKGGWGYSWDAFWIENPKVKSLYRSNEHALQSAEMLATIASLDGTYRYPSQDLYHAWLQLHLNTDRNTLWGAAGGMVFEDKRSWDAMDRFDWIENFTDKVSSEILKKNDGQYLTWFNPVNWQQTGPQYVELPGGKKPEGFKCQKIGDQILFFPKLSSVGTGSLVLTDDDPEGTNPSPLPEIIENKFYRIKIDAGTGEITDISLKQTGERIIREGGVIYSEKAKDNSAIYHALPVRSERTGNGSTKGEPARIEYHKGELAQIVYITSSLYRQNDVQQVIKIYNAHPAIDFDVYLEDLPDKTVTFMDFVPEGIIREESRGIPYGFTTESVEALSLRDEGVHPVIRWSDYTLDNGAGFAVLDRGLPGREISDNKVSVMLNVASDLYMGIPGGLVSGKGRRHFRFALVAYDNEAKDQDIQRMAWEYNSPSFFEISANGKEEKSVLTTSDNIIVQSMQRIDDELEIRFVECKGTEGNAELNLNLPVSDARLTNFLGEGNEILSGTDNHYTIPVRPQQIVTVRFKTNTKVARIKPLKDWTPLVPDGKRAYLNQYNKDLTGHPPRD